MSEDQVQTVETTNRENVLANCPIPIIYKPEDFPNLTQNQLVVVNLLEQRELMTNLQFAAHYGWDGSYISHVTRSIGVVEARRTLWTGRGQALSEHIPAIVRERVDHAKTRDKGCIGSSRLVLETAGVIGVNTAGVTVNLKAEELNVSFTQSINVMAQANELREVSGEAE